MSVQRHAETLWAYECPDCGEGHDGMDTGTERCRSCEEDSS